MLIMESKNGCRGHPVIFHILMLFEIGTREEKSSPSQVIHHCIHPAQIAANCHCMLNTSLPSTHSPVHSVLCHCGWSGECVNA